MPAWKRTDSLRMSTDSSQKISQKQILQDLNLTKEQKVKIKDIRQDAKTKKEAIENDSTLTETQKAQKLQELKKETSAEVDNILTDEQKAKKKQMRQQFIKKRMGDNMKEKDPASSGSNMQMENND